MSRFFVIVSVVLTFLSCTKEPEINPEISNINVKVSIKRFDQKFFSTSPSEFSKLKKEFPFMFPSKVADSIWIKKMQNGEEQFLFEQADSVFGEMELEETDLTSLFQHLKYNYKNFEEPTVITHISNLDYEYPIIYTDSLLFVALDMFLGSNHEVYSSFPKYIAQNYNKENLIVAVTSSIVQTTRKRITARTFLDKMIDEGRFYYELDVLLPEVANHLKIGYTEEKMEWAINSELDVWKYFMENELLYSTDASLNTRFLDLAPFSKFYLASDNDSPGSIGKYIGWQIVRSFMKNNDVTLQQLKLKTPEEIFRKSKYKPRK